MKTANVGTRWLEDLAARWTDWALENLKAAGIGAVSVEMELATWRTLQEIFRAQLRQRTGTPPAWRSRSTVSTLSG